MTPPDASEIEPRQRRDTKSRELPRIKLDIYSGQTYEKQREEKVLSKPKLELCIARY